MKFSWVFLRGALGLLAASSIVSKADLAGCAGDGPKPLGVITALPYAFPVDTQSGVEDFAVWQSKKSLVYRNQKNQLRMVGNQEDKLLAKASTPISPLVDAKENFILLEDKGQVLDLRDTPTWYQYLNASATHLFWDGQEIYSVVVNGSLRGNWYNVYSYKVGSDTTKLVCRFRVRGASDIARGSQFPYFYVSDRTKAYKQEALTLHEINVQKNCEINTQVFPHKFPGPVEEVYRFREIDAIAAKVKHEKTNFLYWPLKGEEKCRYYEIDNTVPQVLSYSEPMIATWSKKKGLLVTHLEKKQQAQLFPFTSVEELPLSQIRLNSDAKTVLFTTLFKGETGKRLMEVNLPEIK